MNTQGGTIVVEARGAFFLGCLRRPGLKQDALLFVAGGDGEPEANARRKALRLAQVAKRREKAMAIRFEVLHRGHEGRCRSNGNQQGGL